MTMSKPPSPVDTPGFFALSEDDRAAMLERYREQNAEWVLQQAGLRRVDMGIADAHLWCPQCCRFVDWFDQYGICPTCEAPVWKVR